MTEERRVTKDGNVLKDVLVNNVATSALVAMCNNIDDLLTAIAADLPAVNVDDAHSTVRKSKAKVHSREQSSTRNTDDFRRLLLFLKEELCKPMPDQVVIHGLIASLDKLTSDAS